MVDTASSRYHESFPTQGLANDRIRALQLGCGRPVALEDGILHASLCFAKASSSVIKNLAPPLNRSPVADLLFTSLLDSGNRTLVHCTLIQSNLGATGHI